MLPSRRPARAEDSARRRVGSLYNSVMAAQTQGTTPATKGAGSVKRRSVAAKPKSSTRAAGKPEIFIFGSYSHLDDAAQMKLHRHLAPWRRDGVTVWWDKNIEPGAELDVEIARKLRQAHIFVALLSPAYLDSNYCWNIEYKRAMGRHARKQMRVVGVVVKPCGWKQTRAAGFKLLPKDGAPPERWSSSDAAFVNVAEGIGEVIKAVRRELATMPPKPSRAVPKSKAPKAKSAAPTKAGAASIAKPRGRAKSG